MEYVHIIQANSSLGYLEPTIFKLQKNCPFHIVSRNLSNSTANYFPTSSSDANYFEISSRMSQHLPIFDSIIPIAFCIVVLMILFNLINFFLSYKVYGEYGWLIYQTQGASIQKRGNSAIQLFLIGL